MGWSDLQFAISAVNTRQLRENPSPPYPARQCAGATSGEGQTSVIHKLYKWRSDSQAATRALKFPVIEDNLGMT